MTSVKTVWTYEDFVALPEDDGMRYEILDGELSVSPTPTYRHQQISARLLMILGAHVQANGLGEVVTAPISVVLAATSVVQPDIIYIANERSGLVSARGTVDGGPTLAVEILSPSTSRNDRGKKKQLFERYGVPHYWIVDHEARAIEVYVATDGVYGAADRRTDDLVDLPPFPGLRIDPAQLWR
jgi:Uma2 family endonuclease